MFGLGGDTEKRWSDFGFLLHVIFSFPFVLFAIQIEGFFVFVCSFFHVCYVHYYRGCSFDVLEHVMRAVSSDVR